MSNPIQEAENLGQAIWIDYIRRGMFASGEFRRYIELGASGVTSNPTIFEKAIVGSTDYDQALVTLARTGKSAVETYEALVMEDIRDAADLLRPVYDRTYGMHGYASLEVSPLLAYDTDGTVEEAKRLFTALDRPNTMIKVPATPEGMPAIRRLIGLGINVNVTLIFSLNSHRQVMEAYIAGLEDLLESNADLGRIASVASFFLSRVDTSVDGWLGDRIRQGRPDLKDLMGKAAVANAKLAYRAFKEAFGGDRFAALRSRGARVQRPLWASTGTKNPAYSDLLYVEPIIEQDTVNTMPPATIIAFLDHGHARATVDSGTTEAERVMERLADAGISLDSITAELLADGVKAFKDSFEKLLAGIEEKAARLLAPEHVHSGVALGRHLTDVEAALADLQDRSIGRRIWKKDHTVWKPDPTEIVDRLGWLAVTDLMHEQTPAIESLVRGVRDTGFCSVVLLGMGGSSLGPEVLRQVFGSAEGYPELMMLDSVVPAWVQSVSEAIDPTRALFLVSSKSGTTAEPNLLFHYFRALVESVVGRERSGQHFVAVTDPGTPLASLAEREGFRHIFLNPSDIGGRYSVLSHFGLVPAALTGIDIGELLDRADRMREGSASCVPADKNPGAWLGATMGAMAQRGVDKLTIVTSPSVSSFGLWAEQLIAESTGKEGKGIIPVAGEPLMGAGQYGTDRLFVYLRVEGDDNSACDSMIEDVESAGRPVLVLGMRDRYDLGAEFYRWEFATAVAGAMLKINPFDQPDVQAAKDASERVLDEYRQTGELPRLDGGLDPAELLAEPSANSYLAVMAYLRPSREVDTVVNEFRRAVTERYRIATTFGYGPRYLHSTGQLHKGGPDSGLFLNITAAHDNDLPVPGQPYTFGTVADAQAMGDLQALTSLGRRVASVHLEGGEQDVAGQLSSALNRSLGGS